MLFKLFLFIILLAPLPFGANRPWIWSLYAIALALLGLAGCLTILLGLSRMKIDLKNIKYPAILACTSLVWAAIQATGIIPESWAHPFWRMAEEVISYSGPKYISVAPRETGTALMRLISYLIVFVISLQFNRRSDYAALTFKSIAYAGFAYAVYGLVIFLGDYQTILWFDKWAYQTDVTATFVNRNSYATYAGLTILAGFPLLFDKIRSSFAYGVGSYFGAQYFIEKVLIRAWFPLLMLTTIASALLLSHSRGGFLSTCMAIFVLFVVLASSRKIKNLKVFFGILPILLIAVATFQMSGEKLAARLDQIALDKEHNERLATYDILLRASAENPWLGFGYGTFENSFRLYRDASVPGYMMDAHNTYLENIFELGLLQASALFLAILLVALQCLRGVWLRNRDWIYPAIGVAATVLVGAHSCVDFSLQIPAVAMTYALIMGAALAQARPTKERMKDIA